MKIVRLAFPAVVLVVLILTACSEHPATTSAAPPIPSFDGGVGLGSGHRDEPDTTTVNSTNQSTQGEGGIGLGSGH
jgi:hypothetical protein